MNDQELLEYVDEVPAPSSVLPPWRILVVDDDADVHESTAFGLRGVEIEGRPLQLLHATSGAEAVALLRVETDVAVLLLDVVMETGEAGLHAVEQIRNDLGLKQIRIVLRTGQPGRAPEIETIRRYDINDYKTKSELTRAKLYTTLTAAVRSYDQLRRLEAGRQDLERIITAHNEDLAQHDLPSFAEAVIQQLAALFGVPAEGMFCAIPKRASAGASGHFAVLAAAGSLAPLGHKTRAELDGTLAATSVAEALRERRNVVGSHHLALFFPGRDGHDYAAFLAADEPLRQIDAQLMRVFCANTALGASNVELMARLREYAFVDGLLGLPNRAALIDRMDQSIDGGSGCGKALALLDIDQFAETNDMFGHVYGDRLLGAIARRLGEGLPADCVLARVTGDTFGIWGDADVVEPGQLAALLERPFEIEGVERPVSLSIGLVRCDGPGADGQELYKNAAIAVKQSKASGQGGAQYYTAEAGVATRERTRLLHGLKQAFNCAKLFVVYQPQLSLASGRAVGAEALLRWRTDDGRFVSPAQFIPVAEQSGLIVPIGNWVLRTALHALVRLRSQGHPLRMAVNVSPVQFAQHDFLAQIDEALADAQLAPECLELEITESVAVMGLDRVAALLQQIKARGIAVAIDDFGTGFSSLSYLDRLPADRLKIDRAFVSALDSGRSGARIAEMIVPLGRRLGMQVLAEGVETQIQATLLQALGCNEVQGYLYAKPMPFDELAAWLAVNLVA